MSMVDAGLIRWGDTLKQDLVIFLELFPFFRKPVLYSSCNDVFRGYRKRSKMG